MPFRPLDKREDFSLHMSIANGNAVGRRLPPLSSLRAFEAAARLRSVSRAAEELAVTQSAISHQLAAFEEWLGQPAFRRAGRGIAPSEAAERILPEVSEAFDQLDRAMRKLQALDPRAGWLTVSMMPSFAAKWLVPRLGAFRAQHPEIDVWIATFEPQSDPLGTDVDVAIRYGDGNWPGEHAVLFLEEDLFPVCAPAMLKGRYPLKKPEDLKRHTLLHDEMREDWRMWLEAAGVKGIDPARGPGFDDSALLIQAAIDGMGVALGRSALVKGDIAAGRLVKPFALILRAQFAYYVTCKKGTEDLPKIRAFRDWLTAASRADESQPGAAAHV